MASEQQTSRPSPFSLPAVVIGGAAVAIVIAVLFFAFGGDDTGTDASGAPRHRPAEMADAGHEIFRTIKAEEYRPPAVDSQGRPARDADGEAPGSDEPPPVNAAGEGFHIEPDLAGGQLEIPDGFHAEFDLGTFVVEDGYHIEYSPGGDVRIIENGFGLGPDDEIYRVDAGFHLEPDSDLTVWQVPDGYGIGPDNEIYEVSEGYHLEATADGQIWEVAEGFQLGPDGSEYPVVEGYHLEMSPDGTVVQVPDDDGNAVSDSPSRSVRR